MDARGVLVVEDPGRGAGGSRPTGVAAMEHVANRPIAHHALEALVDAGIDEVVVASSSERSAEVRACLEDADTANGVALRYVDRPAPFDVAHAIRLAAPLVGRVPSIVHTATGLLEEPLKPLLTHVRSDCPDAVLIVHQGPARYGHLNSATREMLHIAELDPKRAALRLAGVSLFGPRGLTHAAATSWSSDHDVDLTAVANRITAAGGSFGVRLAGLWRDYSGSALDLLELNRIVLDRLEGDQRRGENNGNRIEGRVDIDDAASVHASVIVGPAVIGPRARITDAYIGPYTAVGADARIEGAEIEQSIIAAGATIAHIGCRLAGSVIGRDARVFRDFSLPRAMRLSVGAGTEVALS